MWGANFSIQKAVFAAITPGGFLFVRYLVMPLAAVVLLCAGHGRRWPVLPRAEWLELLKLGIAGHLLHVGMVTYGIHWSTAFSSSLILALGPVFTLLILRWHGIEHLSRAQVAGVAVAGVGVLVFLSDKLLGGHWQASGGDLVLLVAASFFSYYTVAVDQRLAPIARSDVARDDLHPVRQFLHPLNSVEHRTRMPMRRVDHDSVDARINQRLAPLEACIANSRRRRHAQPPLLILAGIRIGLALLHILHGEQADATPLVIDHDQPLDPVLVQQLARLGRIGPNADGHNLPRHQLGHRHVVVVGKPHVAVCDDSQQLARNAFRPRFHHRNTRNLQALLQYPQLAQRVIRRHRHRVHHHAALEPLDAAHLLRLFLDRQVAVDNADAAELRHGNRQAGFGHGVHGRRDDRYIERDVPRQTRADIDLAGNNLGRTRLQQHVVERDGLTDSN